MLSQMVMWKLEVDNNGDDDGSDDRPGNGDGDNVDIHDEPEAYEFEEEAARPLLANRTCVIIPMHIYRGENAPD